MSRIGAMSALWPNRCTGMIAFVFGVRADATAPASILNVAGSMSTNTGRAPSLAIEPAVAKNENGVVTTSSPGPTSSAIKRSKQRIGARRNANGVRNSKKRFELALQAFNLGTEDEVLRIADARDRLEHTVAQRRELRLQVEQRDFLARHKH